MRIKAILENFLRTVGVIAATMEGSNIPGRFPNVFIIPIPKAAYLKYREFAGLF